MDEDEAALLGGLSALAFVIHMLSTLVVSTVPDGNGNTTPFVEAFVEIGVVVWGMAGVILIGIVIFVAVTEFAVYLSNEFPDDVRGWLGDD